jgi:hypothetical protein
LLSTFAHITNRKRMLQSITWSQYCLFLIIATIAFYLFVWIVFFKAKLSLLPGLANIRTFSIHGEDAPDEVMSTAQHIVDELRPLFQHGPNKNELLLSLKNKLKKYNQWEEPGFRETINEFILNESQNKCSICLGEQDQRAVWL